MHAREIKGILDTGRPRHGHRVVVFLAPGSGNLAVIAGKRVGGAVQRNRARRILRAAWTEVASRAPNSDVVLVARAPIRGASTQELVGEMSELLTGAVRT